MYNVREKQRSGLENRVWSFLAGARTTPTFRQGLHWCCLLWVNVCQTSSFFPTCPARGTISYKSRCSCCSSARPLFFVSYVEHQVLYFRNLRDRPPLVCRFVFWFSITRNSGVDHTNPLRSSPVFSEQRANMPMTGTTLSHRIYDVIGVLMGNTERYSDL